MPYMYDSIHLNSIHTKTSKYNVLYIIFRGLILALIRNLRDAIPTQYAQFQSSQ